MLPNPSWFRRTWFFEALDGIWGIWESYYNIPTAIFYLLKGDYRTWYMKPGRGLWGNNAWTAGFSANTGRPPGSVLLRHARPRCMQNLHIDTIGTAHYVSV